jgi:hypothetical protein
MHRPRNHFCTHLIGRLDVIGGPQRYLLAASEARKLSIITNKYFDLSEFRGAELSASLWLTFISGSLGFGQARHP